MRIRLNFAGTVAIGALLMGLSTSALGGTIEDSIRLANKLHKNLTKGVPLVADNPNFNAIVQAVHEGNLEGAAAMITDPRTGEDSFYNNAIVALGQTFNRDLSPVGDRNEIGALFLGHARDGLPIDQVLYTDTVYYDPSITDSVNGVSVPRYLRNPSAHFSDVWRLKNPRQVLKKDRKIGSVGIFTTWVWGKAYFEMGTNRRNWQGVLNNLYCVNQSATQSLAIPDTYVRRDIPRAPAGDPAEYQTNCKSCHAQMDGVMPAFARHDYDPAANNDTGGVVVGAVRDKINELGNFPLYAITTDTWQLFVTASQQKIFGFNSFGGKTLQSLNGGELYHVSGSGLEEFGKLIAASDGFYECLSKRIVSQVYLRKDFSLNSMNEADRAELESQENTIKHFSQVLKEGKNLRKAYELIAIHYAQNQ